MWATVHFDSLQVASWGGGGVLSALIALIARITLGALIALNALSALSAHFQRLFDGRLDGLSMCPSNAAVT